METKNGQRFVTPICYEILESNYMRSLLNEFGNNRFIVNHTNDSWYGDTSEPFHHSLLARWESSRLQVSMLRPTNTGMSQIVAPWGEVLY